MTRNDKPENIEEISVQQAKTLYSTGSFIGNDILLFDSFKDIPLPSDPRRMRCLFLALCTNGKAQYTIDTKQQIVSINDVIILSEGQVAGDYLLSPDCDGIAFMMSYDFYQHIIGGIHELSSLFIFSRTHPVFKSPGRPG